MAIDKLHELREERKKLTVRGQELSAKTDSAALADDEREELRTLKTRATELDEQMRQLKEDADNKAFFAVQQEEEETRQAPRSEPVTTPEEKRIVIPARARPHRDLKAFKYGENRTDNERDAFVAGQMYLAHIFKSKRAFDWLENHGFHRRTLNESSNPAGGFLVPDEMQRTLVRLREERGVFERFARSVPMGADSMFIPRDLSDVTAYWPAEAAEITASDPTYGGAELIAKKLGCLTKVSTELDEDAVVEIGDQLTQSMAYAMADKIDEAGFNGDGTSTYGGNYGLKNALHTNATFTAAGDGFDELTLADGHDCIGKLPQYPGMNPMWFMHSAGYWAWCARLQYAGGGNTVADLGNGPQLQWLGYPVVFTQVLTSTITASTSTIIAYFGDLSLCATVGQRRSVNTQVSVDRYFENDLIGVKATQRLAINVHERGDTIRNRPMIALKTASS